MTRQVHVPGEARAPGPTVADTLKTDRVAPEAPLLERSYQFLGDSDIKPSRYTSREFFEQEMDELWPKAWQWACREEHIPDAGDSYVYDIGVYSVIVTRVDKDTIKAYLNACTHRNLRLLAKEGCTYSSGFACPFHGWSWNIDGSVKNIPGRWDFPHASDDTHRLQEVLCECWGGFVFINMDLNAKPLSHYLDVLPEHFRHFPLDRRRIKVHVQKILPANWKAAQEAFMEAYHNFETHQAPNGANAQYDVFGKYVSRFIHNIGNYSAESLSDYPGQKWRKPILSEQQMLAELPVEQRPLKEGETARSVAAQFLREALGKQLGVDFSATSDCLMMDSIEYHLFPNMFFFPGISIPMVYRFKPLGSDVDKCIFDLMILEPLADGVEHPTPPEPEHLDIEQSYTEVAALSWLGAVYDQDTDNLHQQQQGFKITRKGSTLGNYQEARIRRVHITLDEFLNTGA